jgi:hypothetical protein
MIKRIELNTNKNTLESFIKFLSQIFKEKLKNYAANVNLKKLIII